MINRKPSFRDSIRLISGGPKLCVSPLGLENKSQSLSNSAINRKYSYLRNSKCRSFLQIFLAYATVVSFACLPASVLAQKAQSGPYKQFGKVYGKVAVITQNGDVKPIAKRMFYVLPFALWELNLKSLDEGRKLYYSEERKLNQYREDKINEAMQRAKNEGRFFSFKTEFDGSYSLGNIPPGNYFVCNAYQDSYAIHIGQSSIVSCPPSLSEWLWRR